jgi:tetratricopeptide (TPR) repeat protein
MGILRPLIVVSMVALAAAPGVQAQQLGGVGGGPSQTFLTNLPSYDINRTLGTSWGYTMGSQFARGASPAEASYLAAHGIETSYWVDAYRPLAFLEPGMGPGLGPLVGLKLRTIESLSFEKRGRFAKLHETTLALAERIRKVDEASLAQVNIGFRQFMFPLPLTDLQQFGYGFFSRTDLVGAGAVKPEAFLAPFTDEIQRSLGEQRFLDATQALLAGRALPEGMAIDQFYDPQLAALANFLFNNGKYAGAGEAWAVLVERDSANATASRGLAISLLAVGQMRKAATEARRSLTLMRGWPDKVKIAGSNLQDIFPNPQDLANIRQELEAQLAKQPGDRDLGFIMAYVDLFHGNWGAAEDRLAKLAADDEVARGLLAVMKRGDVAQSIRRPAQSALRRVAEELTGLEEAPMTPEARAKLIAALRSGATGYEDNMRVGDFRFFMGDFTEASEAYRAAHKAKPEDAFALFALAHVAFANSEYRQAARYLDAALAIEPGWGLFEFRIQEFYGDKTEYERQLKDLERLVELRPSQTEMKFLLAYIYYFSGRYSEATALLTDVIRLDPRLEKANYFLRLARLQG